MTERGPSLVATVRATLDARGLLAPGGGVLVACSGGPDSVAMLDTLHRLSVERRLRLVVASVDHGLRPEARDEVALVARLADERGLGFVAVALGLAEGSSMATARRARYAALARVARHADAAAIAVGHTRDDQAETVLGRLVRGAGLRGLRAIAPARADGVVRPLIDASRAQVEAHLAHHGIPFVSDPTNLDASYLRVRLRREVLPRLAQEDPAVAEHLAALADEAAALAEYVDSLVAPWVERRRDAPSLLRSELAELPAPFRPQAIAALIAARTGHEPGRRVLLAVTETLERGGSVWIPGGYALEGVSGELRWTRAQRPEPLARPRR